MWRLAIAVSALLLLVVADAGSADTLNLAASGDPIVEKDLPIRAPAYRQEISVNPARLLAEETPESLAVGGPNPFAALSYDPNEGALEANVAPPTEACLCAGLEIDSRSVVDPGANATNAALKRLEVVVSDVMEAAREIHGGLGDTMRHLFPMFAVNAPQCAIDWACDDEAHTSIFNAAWPMTDAVFSSETSSAFRVDATSFVPTKIRISPLAGDHAPRFDAVGLTVALQPVDLTLEVVPARGFDDLDGSAGKKGFDRGLQATFDGTRPAFDPGRTGAHAELQYGGERSADDLDRSIHERPSATTLPRTAGPAPFGDGVMTVLLLIAPFLPAWLMYRTIRRGSELDQERRRRLFEHVVAEPGLTPAALGRATGLHYSTCRHHLRVLRAAELVQVRRVGGRLCVFENHPRYGIVSARVFAAARNPRAKRLLRLLARTPGLTQAEAARALGVARPSLLEMVKKLSALGLVELAKDGRFVRLRLTPVSIDTVVGLTERAASTPEQAATAP